MKEILAEVITIGDEILIGQITNTNTQWISAELHDIGVRVVRQTTVGDSEQAILGAFQEAQERADIILVTGGLGPTKDDITKKTIAKFFNVGMESNPEALKAIESYFQQFQRPMKPVHVQMADLPTNAVYLSNKAGTAPGMWFEENGKVLVSMPGVPIEMKTLMTEAILPKLKNQFQTPIILHKTIRTVGAGESHLAELIEEWEDNLPQNLKLAYLPNFGQVRLRLTGVGQNKDELDTQMNKELEQMKPFIFKYIFGYEKEELEEVVADLLLEHKKTIATAESCTGGYLSHLFTKIAGSSRYFQGGVVAYSNEIKMQELEVKAETLEEHGAVSEATIRQMAENVRRIFKTDIGVASSGIAGPGGARPDKPVGTVWVAYADEKGTYAKKLQLTTERWLNIILSAQLILDLIRKKLTQLIP